jgi:hypothetical protein
MRNKMNSENSFPSFASDAILGHRKDVEYEKLPEIKSKNDNAIERVCSPVITLNEYLSRHNRNRILDNIIRKWFFHNNKNNPNPKKSKEEWDSVMKSFQNETDK